MDGKGKRVGVIILIIFIVLVAGLYVYLYLIPSITGSLTPTYIVQDGVVSITDDPKCFIVRDEEVYYAEKSGSITYYSKETEKTRKGFVVADIYNGNKYSMQCPSTGFVSYYLDDYENYFTPDNIGKLDIEEYVNLEIVPYNSFRNDVVIGEAIYKLIKSNTWYMLLVVPNEELSKYAINNQITIWLNEENKVNATIDRFLGNGETRIVVCSTKTFYEDFAKIRTINVNVVTKETSGLFVPTTAIAVEGEDKGVYVLGVDGEYVFKKIDVLVEDEDLTLISKGGNVKLYDEILRNASNDKSN